MLNGIIRFSLANRALVILCAVIAAGLGVFAMLQVDIDAFPDTTPVQVQINTVAAALGPEEVERQITIPLEQAIGSLPKLESMRSISKFGFSQVVVTFQDGTDIYFARQVVNERLGTLQLAQGIQKPQMGPISTGLGEVFHYVVTGKGNDITELRTIHDWVIRPKMRTVPGAAEINGWGGHQKQYQVRLDPKSLVKHGLTFDQVARALEENNRNVGGGNVQDGTRSVLVQGVGRVTNIEQIAAIVIATHDGVPIRVGDVAEISIGAEIRRGAVTVDGKGEAILGLGFMLMGENAHEVTWAMKDRLNDVAATLPANVSATPVYDRTELVQAVIETARNNLFEGGLLVVATLFLFLGSLRAALIVALAIPLSMLFAFSGMWRFGVSASLLSLGAIDFGMIVDSSVVMIENCARHASHADARGRSMTEIVRDAALEVRKPTMFGELIIMIVYLPILTLEGIEGKLFRPMAMTVVFALIGSMILSVTLQPVLASMFLTRQREEREPLLMRWAHRLHAPLLRFSMRHKFWVVCFALVSLFVAFGMIAPNLGSEFMPRLSEGAVAINVTRLTGTSLEDSVKYNTQIEKVLLATFPDEIEHVWSRIGSAEIATDPMGVELADIFITLKPRKTWKKAANQDDLTALIERELRDMPGQELTYLQPIQLRMNEMVTGGRAAVSVKLYGDDLDTLAEKAVEIQSILNSVPGAADVAPEQTVGLPVLEIVLKQDQLARYGVSAKTVTDVIESVGGMHLGEVVEGQLRFPLVLRMAEKYRRGKDGIREIVIPTDDGKQIPLHRLADIRVQERPSTISREWGQRRIAVAANVRGRDLGGFVAEARREIDRRLQLPPGRYFVEFGGEFELMQRANTRLAIVVPAAGLAILILLHFTYGNLVDALRVFTGLPFGWVGGIIALWVRDMPFSISAAIGFIALSGVAVLDDMILVSYVRQLRNQGLPLDQAVTKAAITRLRPVLMTTLVASLGFLPMAFSDGMGAEVQRPLATVVIGGVIGAMFMSLLVLRVLYMLFPSPRSRATRSSPELVAAHAIEEPVFS